MEVVIPGFANGPGPNFRSIMWSDNVDFSGAVVPTETVNTNGQLLIGSTAAPNIRVGNLTSSDSSITISNGSGTIDLKTNPAVVPDLHVAKWIVNATPNSGGNQTTIAAALTAATSGDTIFITPGTYTENLTLKAGVNLTAFGCDSSLNGTGHVIINGTCSFSSAGSVTISGIQLQTNSAALLSITGSAASIVNLNNCYLNCSNTTGITFSVANAAAALNISNCTGNLGTTGISYLSDSSTGKTMILNSNFLNSGNSVTVNTKSAGIIAIFNSTLPNPLTYSSTSTGSGIFNSDMDNSTNNSTMITTSGTGGLTISNSYIASGSASAISIGTGTTVTIASTTINSTNTNAITGAGSIAYNSIAFTNTSNTINTTTQTGSGTLQGSKNTAPSAGFLGERIVSAVTSQSASNGTPFNVTSISLTAGIWDVSAITSATFSVGGNAHQAGISSSTGAFAGNIGDQTALYNTTGIVGILTIPLSVPSFRVTLSATTTYFLVGQANFGSGTASINGRISATRVG